ncbi:MAG TPA: hypothetical protein VHF88_03190 [Thermoleophilaceae bacterium]|nr:hypothetical protein [Thermoleophilaceae bacterium]
MRRPRHPFLDLLLALWVVGWLALAYQVASEVRGLRDLSETVTETGVAVRESGEALGSLSDLPLVGDRVAEPAQRIEAAGQSAADSGRSTRDSIDTLSILLAIAIGGIPPIAVLGIYLQLRREQTLVDEARGRAGRSAG